MKRYILLCFLLTVWGLGGLCFAQSFGSRDRGSKLELPVIRTGEQVIVHIGYTTSYNSKTLNPDWVAYELTKEEVQGECKGKTSFCWDPDVKGRKSRREDYKNEQDWDKGHMAPRADMKWSVQAFEESYYLSNICPQNHDLNAGDWLKTENLARRMAEKYGKVYIVCGPVFTVNRHGTLGENKVWIPDAFYKALLVAVNGRYEAIAFYMTNESQKNDLKSYIKTVDDVEKLVGRDLFPTLSDSVEEEVESRVNRVVWGLK